MADEGIEQTDRVGVPQHGLVRQEPVRRGLGFRGGLGLGLLGFLLGAGAAGYLAWRGDLPIGGLAERLGLGGYAAEAVSPPAGRSATSEPVAREAETALHAAEIVAQQQGGIDQRLAALEQRMSRLDLRAEAASGNIARAEGLLIAFAARRAMDRGAPLGYLADQLRLRFGDAKPNAVRIVIEAARTPMTIDMLAGRLDAIGPQLEQAQDKTGFAWIGQELSELFIIRRASAPSPAAHSRLERARLFLDSGRVEAAIAEVRNMPGAQDGQKSGARKWIADAERYAAAQQALDLLETSAILEPRNLKDESGRKVEQESPLESLLRAQ